MRAGPVLAIRIVITEQRPVKTTRSEISDTPQLIWWALTNGCIMYRCVNDFHCVFFTPSWGSFFDLNAFQDLSGTSQCLQARSENGLSLAFLQSVQRLYTRRFFVVISLFYNRYYNIIWLVILIFSVLFNPNKEWIYLKRSTEAETPLSHFNLSAGKITS